MDQVVREAGVHGWDKIRWDGEMVWWKEASVHSAHCAWEGSGGTSLHLLGKVFKSGIRWLSVLIFLSRVHAWVESKDFYYKLGFRLVMVTFVTSIHHFKLLLYSQLSWAELTRLSVEINLILILWWISDLLERFICLGTIALLASTWT